MKYLKSFCLMGCVAVLAAGCASAPSRFYTLNSTAKSSGTSTATYAVIVGPVFVPATVDRPQFVVASGANTVEIEEFNRWAAPLGDSIARVVSTDLGALLGTSRVGSAPLPDFGPAYRVMIRVERFETMRGDGAQSGAALIDALWVVRDQAGASVASGHTIANEPATGASFDALAAAHSRALAKVSTEIATAIRDVAGEAK